MIGSLFSESSNGWNVLFWPWAGAEWLIKKGGA